MKDNLIPHKSFNSLDGSHGVAFSANECHLNGNNDIRAIAEQSDSAPLSKHFHSFSFISIEMESHQAGIVSEKRV
jgi:hypothetical protein